MDLQLLRQSTAAPSKVMNLPGLFIYLLTPQYSTPQLIYKPHTYLVNDFLNFIFYQIALKPTAKDIESLLFVH